MSISIDSSEVLHHLNSYGIHSIDDNSLKSFIKDLKKLIKYEHYRNTHSSKLEESNPPHEPTFVISLAKDGSSSAVNDHRRKKSCCRMKCKENIPPVYSEDLAGNNKVHYQEIKSTCSCQATHSHLTNQRYEAKKETNSQKSHGKGMNRKTTDEINENCATTNKLQEHSYMKRPSSLLSSTRSQTTNIRTKKGHCDPVELYHYYQSFWKNHKLPGENDHAGLRLAIRKRLMNVK